MHFTSEPRLSDGVVERDFTLGEIPGLLWTPQSAATQVPLILLGHPGGLRQMYPRLAARARRAAADGSAAATIELVPVSSKVAPPVTRVPLAAVILPLLTTDPHPTFAPTAAVPNRAGAAVVPAPVTEPELSTVPARSVPVRS